MNSPEPSWDLYRSFLAVLEQRSLSGAARQLGLTQPTLARHIAELEAHLGLTLFLRTPRGLLPTDAADTLGPHAAVIASATGALLRAASGTGKTLGGTVRITASEVIAAEVLPPILAQIRERWPGLEIELVATNVIQDLLRRDADIAVRTSPPAQDALIARSLGAITLGLHAHPSYLERRGTPKRLQDLQHHNVIGYDRISPAKRAILARLPGYEKIPFALRLDNDLAQLAAIRAGFGLGICQVALARRPPALTRCLRTVVDIQMPVWIVMHENLRSTPRCQAVFAALAEGMAQYVDAKPAHRGRRRKRT